jgi:hypothetical protein
MSQAARVLSVATLESLREALTAFADQAKDVLFAVDCEVRRTGEWLEDQLRYWQAEVRRCEDRLHEAKQELARRKIMRVGDRPPDCTEQEKAVRRAVQALEHAEEKRERTRQWVRDLPRAVTDYESRARQMMTLAEGDVPRACALLERKAEALEAYLALQKPAPPRSGIGLSPPPAPEEEKP